MSKKELMSDEEIKTVEIMAIYWDEVRQRADNSPLLHEAKMIADMFNVRLPFIIKEYVENIKQKRGIK